MRERLSVDEVRADYEARIEKMNEQLSDLADHIRHKPRVSRARTADAILAVVQGGEWRVGKWP